MKVLVAIKRVIDPYVKIRVRSDGTGVETNNVKMTINPFCEIAVEEAVRLKEADIAKEVVVVSIGDASSQEQLRTALALGADRAIHVDAPFTAEPLAVAKILKAIMEKEAADIVLLGKQSIDTDNNQVAQMLGALSGRPQGTFASELSIEPNHAVVTREIDGGLETLRLSLPAIISTDLRLNDPRYASLPNIMKAKRKPMECTSAEELDVCITQHQQILDVLPPATRSKGVMVADVSELVDKLKNQEKVM